MPNAKRHRKARPSKPAIPGIPPFADRVLKEVGPLLRGPKLSRSRATRHMRNATIEVLEAMRAVLDETIDWLRHDGHVSHELKRIRVEG